MPKPGWLTLTKSDPTLSWYEKLENKSTLVIWTVLLLMIVIVAASSLRISWAYDIYWHLQMGKDWIENGLSPWRDHYSFTVAGDEIRSPAALFEAGIYYLVEWVGLESALKLYKFLAQALTLCLAAVWLRNIRAPVVAFVLVLPLIGLLLQLRSIERPELIGYSLLVLGVILYERARTRRELSASTMLPIVALMVFWTNYHGAILGYVLFFGLFVDFGWKYLASRASPVAWIRWCAWGVVVLAAGFLKPNFSHPVIEMLTFSPEWKSLIIEYRSPVSLRNVPPIYFLVALTTFTLWMLARQKKVGYLIVGLIFIYNAATVIRMVVPAGILMMCLFALVLRDAQPGIWLQSTSDRKSKLFAASVWIVLVVTLITSVSTARSHIRSNVEIASRYPDNMIEYMREQELNGRVFNEYQIGGYLIWGMEGDLEVFIDGRTEILYSVEHYRRYEQALKSPEVLRSEIENHDIQYSVLSNRPEHARLITETGMMGLDYVDLLYALYRRDGPALPTLGYLWGSPACWQEDLAQAIAAERVRALFNLPPLSPLLPFAQLVADYTAAENAQSRKDILNGAELAEVVARRFVGYRALAHEDFQVAANAFDGLAQHQARDLLAGAWAHSTLGDFQTAEERLDLVTRMPLTEVHSNDLVLLYRLLRSIADEGQLKTFDSDYLDELADQIRQIDRELLDAPITYDMFCTSMPPMVAGAR